MWGDMEPDIVIMITSPYTAMRIVQGYTYAYGFAQNIMMSGMGALCSELTVRPWKNQDMNISMLCSNTRFTSGWGDDEVGVAFPHYMLAEILTGVKSTMNEVDPDEKKEKIIERMNKSGVQLEVRIGKNYYNSCRGVEKMQTCDGEE